MLNAAKGAVLALLSRVGLGSTIARNSVFLLAGEGIARALNLVIAVLLYRHLGPEGSGTLRLVVGYGVLLGAVSEFGLSRATSIDLVRSPRERFGIVMGRLHTLRALQAAVFLALAWGSLLLPSGREIEPFTRLLILVWSVNIVLQGFRRDAEVAFQSVERMHFHAGFMLLNRSLTAVLMLGVILAGGGVGWVFAVYLVSDLVDAAASNWTVERRVARTEWAWEPAALRALFVASIPFGLQMVATQLNMYADSLLIYFLYSGARSEAQREIGWYQAAYQLVFALQFVPVALSNALFPQLTRSYVEDRGRLHSLFGRSYGVFFLTGMPVGLFFFTFRREVTAALFGGAYGPTAGCLGVVIWSLPLLFLIWPLTTLLAASERQSSVTVVAFVQAGVNIGLNALLVPERGGMGAALAMTASQAVSLALLLAVAVGRHRPAFRARQLAPQVILHGAAAAALVLADGAPTLARAGVFAVYLAVCAVVGQWLISRKR
jgi:O-antigen/teichoic acid export membrane protein